MFIFSFLNFFCCSLVAGGSADPNVPTNSEKTRPKKSQKKSSCMMARACCSLTYSVRGMILFLFVLRQYLNRVSCRFCVMCRGGMPTSTHRAVAWP